MPLATPDVYAAMLDKAKAERFAYPAINVTSSQTLHAAMRGFAEAGSDGIVQVSTGGAEFLSGATIKDMVAGSLAFAAFAEEAAKKYPVNIALHTDHCPKDKLDGFVRPLLEVSKERVAKGGLPVFQSHMWDGSAVPLDENLEIAKELLAKAAEAKVVLEIEIGIVGGEEDGVEGGMGDHLYTTPEDALRDRGGARARRERSLPDGADVRQRARRLQARQRQAAAGDPAGGAEGGRGEVRPGRRRDDRSTWSSTAGPAPLLEEIHEALDYGVIKMNVDTDTQYAFTRPIVDHMFANYTGVLKVDGEVGDKKTYDPRSYGKAAEDGMATRVVTACENLKSAGTALS